MSVYRLLASVDATTGPVITIAGRLAVTPGTAATRPDQMAAPTVTPGNNQIIVAAPTPPNLHGLALLGYEFRAAPSADLSAWTYHSSLTFPYSITKTNGTLYDVQQAARTDAGLGLWSASTQVTPAGTAASVPAQMAPPSLAAGVGTITVNLAEGTANNGAAIDREDVRHAATQTGPAWTELIGVSDPVTVSSGLTGGVDRWFASRAHNSVGAGAWSDAVKGTPLTADTSFPAATAVVSNANLVTTLNAWKAGWNATAAALGISTAAPRYLDVLSGNYPLLKLTGYNFPAPVHIRSADRDNLGAAWVKIEIYDSNNLGFDFVSVVATGMHGDNNLGALHFGNCTGAFFEYGQVRGPADYQVVNESKQDGVMLKNSPAVRVRHTLITDWPVGMTIEGCPGALIEGSVWNDMKGDDGKCSYSNGAVFLNNWSSLTKRKYDPLDHVDFFQEQTATASSAAPATVDGHHWIGHMLYLKTVTGKSVQGLYVSGKGLRKNFTNVDCVLVTTNNDCSWKTNPGFVTGDASNVYDGITALYPPPNGAGGYQWQGTLEGNGGSKTDCIEAMGTSYTPPAGNLKINIGVNYSSANYAAQHAYYTGPIQQAASSKSPMHELMPVAGTQAHWGHASPKGGWRRLKAIIEDGLHPGNSPNKVLAAHWQSRWNWDGFVTT